MQLIARRAALALLLAAGAVVPATAQEAGWTARLGVQASDYSKQYGTSYFGNAQHLRIEDGRGFTLAGGYRWGLVAVEGELGRLSFDAHSWTTEIRPLSFDPLVLGEVETGSDDGKYVVETATVSLLFHPRRAGRLDPYLGPLVGVARYRVDVDAQDRERDLAYGGRLGLQWWLGASRSWAVGGEYRYLQLSHDAEERDLYGDMGLGVLSLNVSFHAGHREP